VSDSILNNPALVAATVVLGMVLCVVIIYYAAKLYKLMNGLVAGLVFTGAGIWMLLGPTYYLLEHHNPTAVVLFLLSLCIILGLMAIACGVFGIMNFRDF
jgi:uncharacterized membrane protein